MCRWGGVGGKRLDRVPALRGLSDMKSAHQEETGGKPREGERQQLPPEEEAHSPGPSRQSGERTATLVWSAQERCPTVSLPGITRDRPICMTLE